MGASYAVGVVRGGRLLLAPLDQVMQLRPSLAHLDRGGGDKALTSGDAVAADERVSGAGPAVDAMDEDDANGMEMEPVRVCTARGVGQFPPLHLRLTICAVVLSRKGRTDARLPCKPLLLRPVRHAPATSHWAIRTPVCLPRPPK